RERLVAAADGAHPERLDVAGELLLAVRRCDRRRGQALDVAAERRVAVVAHVLAEQQQDGLLGVVGARVRGDGGDQGGGGRGREEQAAPDQRCLRWRGAVVGLVCLRGFGARRTARAASPSAMSARNAVTATRVTPVPGIGARRSVCCVGSQTYRRRVPSAPSTTTSYLTVGAA